MDEVSEVASVIENHVQCIATLETGNSLLNTPDIFFLSLAFPGKDRDTGSSDAVQLVIMIHVKRHAKWLTLRQHDLE